MAQVDFYLCIEEKMKIADMLFSLGRVMIPDLHYETKEYTVVTNLAAYEQYVADNVLMFIVDPPAISAKSMIFGAFKKNGKETFFIRQRHGYPSIDFYSPGIIEQKEHKIGPGFIGDYPFYYDESEGKFFPPEENRLLFKQISSFLKSMSISVKLINRTYWIGKETINLCKVKRYELISIGEQNLLELLPT